MKTLLTLVLALVTQNSAFALNIQKGDWEVGGALNFSQGMGAAYGSRSQTSFYLLGSAQSFVADQFSVGLGTSFSIAGYRTGRGSLGPLLTKYFLVRGNLAPYISLTPLELSKREGVRPELLSSLRLGTKFFLTDSVAFGPAVQYLHHWSRYSYESPDQWSVLGAFSIHL